MSGSTRPWLLLFAVLLSVAAATLCWWPRGAAPPVVLEDEASGAGRTNPESAPIGAARTEAPVAERTGIADETAAPRLRVRVVVAATGEPVAAAGVCHVPADFGEQGQRPAEARALAEQAPLRTDSAGFTELALQPGRAELLFCRHGDLWAEAIAWRVPEDGAPVVLELRDDLTLRVLVLGPAGEPVAGAPVTVAAPERMNGRELLVGGNLQQPTGADGLATFAHLQARVGSPTVLALLDLPLPERALANVDLAHLPREPVVLRLPATGSLTLRLDDGQGPYVPDRLLLVAIEDRTPGNPPLQHTYPMRDGVLALPHLALLRRLSVKIDCDWCRGEQLVDGPVTAGEHLEVALHVVRQPVLTGRLVDEARAPLAGENWQAVYAAGEWTSYHVWFETDAAGRFRMPLPAVFTASSELMAVIVPADKGGAATRTARIALPDWILQQPKDLDLGDVVVAPPPVVVDGVVVDQQGAPLAGVKLRVQEHRDGIRETAIDSNVESDEGGRFSIRAFLPAKGLHLVAEKTMHQAQDVPITRGQRDLRVVMPATGRIVAKVLLDAGLPTRLLLASCTEGASGHTQTWGCHLAIEDGLLTFDDVTPGTATLALRPVGESEPVWSAASVAVRGGEVTTLPEIDLRGRLRAVRVRTLDDERHPVLEASVRLDPDRGGAREQPVTHDGALQLLLHRPIRCVVHADGRANALLTDLFADAEVTLHAALSLELQLQQPPPEAPLQLEAVVELAGVGAAAHSEHDRQWRDSSDLYEFGDGRSLSSASGVVGADGRARLLLPVPGTWKLRWRLRRGDVSVDLDGAPTELVLGAAAGPVSVAVAPAALATALQRLR